MTDKTALLSSNQQCSPHQLRCDAETCDVYKQGPIAHDLRWAAAEIERLRAALERILVGTCDDPKCTSMFHEGCDVELSAEQRARQVARLALRPADETTGEQK